MAIKEGGISQSRADTLGALWRGKVKRINKFKKRAPV
jgi:hypothetical protein